MTIEGLAAVVGLIFVPVLAAVIKLYSDVQQLKAAAEHDQGLHVDLKNISDRLIRVEVLLDRRLPKE